MSYKLIKEEFDNISQDNLTKDFYYTLKGNCYLQYNESNEKILESQENVSSIIANKNLNIDNPLVGNLNPEESNHGIKFSAVCSGKNIIIHGGGTIATLGNANQEDYVLVGGIVPRGVFYLEFICPVSCQGLSFGMATLNEVKDLTNLKKNFKSFRTSSRRRVGMEINYEERIVKFYLEGILKDKTFSIKEKNLSFPCIILNNKSVSVIINPFARLSNEVFPFYFAPNSIYNGLSQSIFSKLLFLTNIPKIKLESKYKFLKTHFEVENLKEENIFIPINSEREIKGIIILKFEEKAELNKFKDKNKAIRINNNEIKIIENNYLNDLTEKNIFKIIDLISMSKKENMNCDISIKQINPIENINNDYCEEDKLIVEFIIENYKIINFFQYSIKQLHDEIQHATERFNLEYESNKIYNEEDIIKDNSNLKLDYLPLSDKMFLIDNESMKVFARNCHGLFDFEFYNKESKRLLDVNNFKGFTAKNKNNSEFMNVIVEKLELSFLLKNLPWENIFNEVIDYEILKSLTDFVNGLKNIKELKNNFILFPLRKKFGRKLIEIFINYINRIVFIHKEKNKIENLPNQAEDENKKNVEIDQLLPFAPDYEEPLNEENKQKCFYDEYKNLSTETILLLYRIIIKILEQIEFIVPLSKEKHSTISQCIRWGSAYSRLSTFISFPNFMNEVSVLDLANKGFYVDHTLYNELKFHGHNFIRSLTLNKIKDQESLDYIINQEYPFNFNCLSSYWPNIELAYSINVQPPRLHSNPITKEIYRVKNYNKSNVLQILITASDNGIANIWDYTLGLNLLGYLNVKKGLKEINSFLKIKEVFWMKNENNPTIKSLTDVLNEENFDALLISPQNASNENPKDKNNIVPNSELVNNLYIMGFPLEACKHALKENKNNFDKALEYLLEKSNDPTFMKTYNVNQDQEVNHEKISPWNCDLCTYLNSKGLLYCEMCGANIPNRILNESIDQVIRKKEEENKNKISIPNPTEEDPIVEFKESEIKNIHIIIDKNDPMAPIIVCAVLFDLILNKVIVSFYKLMINPIIIRDFISFEKDHFISVIDSRKFNKLDHALTHIIEKYSLNILSLYPIFNKGVNSLQYDQNSLFFSLIPIEHCYKELNVNSFYDSFAFEYHSGSEFFILTESINNEITINRFKIKNKPKHGNIIMKSLTYEYLTYNLNDFFLNEFPTELKIINDLTQTYIIDQSKIRIFDEGFNLIRIKEFERIGLFKRIEPIYDKDLALASIKIFDDINKFNEIYLDNDYHLSRQNLSTFSNNMLQNYYSNNVSKIEVDQLENNEIAFLSNLLHFEKINLQLGNRQKYSIINIHDSLTSKKIFVDLSYMKSEIKKDRNNNNIKIDFENNVPLVISNINFYLRSKNKSLKTLNYFSEHILKQSSQNIFDFKEMNTELDNRNELNNLIPITVADFKGAQFQQFINVSSIIYGKNFTSNYHKPEFLFMHIHEKIMSVNSVVVGSELISKTGEIPFGEGLLFLINDLDSISLAHEFVHFNFNSFCNFVRGKKEKKEEFFQWEPSAYINMSEKEFIRTKIYESRPCKYILLLPTNARSLPKNFKKGFNTSFMSLNLFAVEGTVLNSDIEQKEPFLNSVVSLLKNNSIPIDTEIRVKIDAIDDKKTTLLLKDFPNLNINGAIPNTFFSFENTDIFISKNRIENLSFPDTLISSLNVQLENFEVNQNFEILGFTIECETFKKIDDKTINSLVNFKSIDIDALRMTLIDKNNFELFNKKFCDVLCKDNLNNIKKSLIMKYFNNLILRIPSTIEKICTNLDLTKFIILNILQNDEEKLINSCLSFIISIKLTLKSENIIRSIFEILDLLENIQLSYLGLKSFILLLNNIFREVLINSNDSLEIKTLYQKVLKIINNILYNLNHQNPLSDIDVFIKTYLKVKEFPSDDKAFCINKGEVSNCSVIKQFSLIPNNCYVENNDGSIRFTLDLHNVHNIKSIKLNFTSNEQPDNFFKLLVWGSQHSKNQKDLKEDYKLLYYKNFLDNMWKQLTKYESEMKVNEKYFMTKDYRSLEINSLNHSCRYLVIEVNTNQGQRTIKKLPNIIIIPEVVGELIHDAQEYTYSSVSDLYEGFISNKIEKYETLNKNYNIKSNTDGTRYIVFCQDDTCDNLKPKKESSNSIDSNISQIKNSLKSHQNQLENFVNEYTNNIDIFDANASNKILSTLENIKILQKNVLTSEKLTRYKDLKESQYILINLLIKQIRNLIDKSSINFEIAFKNILENDEKIKCFINHYIESLILNCSGEYKEDSIAFLDNNIWNMLKDDQKETIFDNIYNKYLANESRCHSSRVLLESISKIDFKPDIILKKLEVAFQKKYQEKELADAFYSISSLILLLIMKVKNEKTKKSINYELLIGSSLKIINNLTQEVKFAKEVDDLILSHSLNLLQESYSSNSFESLNAIDSSLLVDFMIETLFNLWGNEYIKNKLFFIINKMIDPLSCLEMINKKEDKYTKGDLDKILKYTQNILINVQNFSIKFCEKLKTLANNKPQDSFYNSNHINSNENNLIVMKLEYVLNLGHGILSIHHFLMESKKKIQYSGSEEEFSNRCEQIKQKNFELVNIFLQIYSEIKIHKIGYSIQNNLWQHILNIILTGDINKIIQENTFEVLIFEGLLKCNEELKDYLYSRIINTFKTIYSKENDISIENNDKLMLVILRLIDNIENSEKILLPFINQLLELIACGESPYIEKKNNKLNISENMKEKLLIQSSNYILKYLNYSSFTGSTSSNKLILQHLGIGISLLHIVTSFAQEYLHALENITKDISITIRNFVIFVTFNQYSDFSNATPTVLKISILNSQANKIIDICCKKKILIEVILTEFMLVVRKIDENLISKIKNSEISIKKGIVISKKLYYSLDYILNKCLYDDEITKFFAFKLQGFKFFVERVNRHKKSGLLNNNSSKMSNLNYKLNKELLEYLTEESKLTNTQVNIKDDEIYNDSLDDLNYDEFALNGKLILIDDPVNINTSTINWSIKKKGANNFLILRDLKDKTYYEDVFSFKLDSLIELKNVYIGFTYSTSPDKISDIIPSVFFLAGETPEKYNTCIKLEKISDNFNFSVFTYGFNFFASNPKDIPLNDNYIENLFNQFSNCKAKYFKFIIRRPIVVANENSFKAKTNSMQSVCLNHVSIFGTKIAEMGRVIEYIQEEEKNVSIKIISKIFTAEFIDTLKYFAKDTSLIENIKEIYDAYEPYIDKHANILSNILINVSKYVYELGEWLLNRLLNVDNSEIHAKLAVEITQNSPEYVNDRVNKYLNFILNELNPNSPIFYSNNTETRLGNLGKFADYLAVILNGLMISPFFDQALNIDLDINKFIVIIQNLSKYSSIAQEINKLITILLIPNKKIKMRNYLDFDEAINLLHSHYVETCYYDYALILSFLIANNQGYEKIAIKKNIVSFYFDQFLDQVNNGLRGKNMLFLMQIIKNLSFSNKVLNIIKEYDYDFKILNSIKNKDPNCETILINNNAIFLDNIVTFLRNSIIKREDCHIRLAKILIEDLEVCKLKIDKIYANNILMPLLRMENTINLCLHPVDSFFNSILSTYCNIGHLTCLKDEKVEKSEPKFLNGSSLSNKAIDIFQKILTSHSFNHNYKFSHKQFNLKFSSDAVSSNQVKAFIEGISEIENILILFYNSKPTKDCNGATAFFLESKFPKISSDYEESDYPEYFIPYSEKNVLIQFDNDKFNKNVLKTYDADSIGELIFEGGHVSFNFFCENDNPIRINISPEENTKVDFSIKLSLKNIEKNHTLEFKNIVGSYFEIFTCDNKQPIKDTTASSGKIIPSKYIDTNGNLDYEKIKSLKYFKKNHPLLVTRSNPIYEIPSNITIKHLKSLFGSGDLSIKFLISQQTLSDDNVLVSLLEKYKKLNEDENILDICYDINQLRGVFTPPHDPQNMIQNYEPNLPVYKAFEKLDGIMKIISVLKSSILLWKNKEAMNNWLKWVDDVEKFSVLPTFFSTLIRHQKCFNVIFDLLCGFYDQENFNKEICVETSNYIYEIINNTFLATESPNIRYIAIEKEIFKNILHKLEILTREKPRKYIVDEKKENEEDKESKNTQQAQKADEKKSKKGVGYGSDHTGDNKSWDVNSYLESKKTNSEQIAAIIKLLANFFNTKEFKINKTLNNTILESVILPVLESAYRGGTLLELAKQDALYYAYLELTLRLSENKNLITYLLNISKDYKPIQSESVYSLLGQLNDGAKIFSNCIKRGPNEEKTLEEKLALEINKTYDVVSKNIKNYQTTLNNEKDYSSILKLPVEKSYCLLMKELSFDYMNMKDAQGKIIHYYSTSLSKDNPKTKLIRLAQEYADLSRSLPCEHTNSIFVRVDEENMDLLKVLIMGSCGTPYAHGAFEFDVYFDSNYPSGPPKVTLVTTGSGSVRFNPNLYSNGKVCLSLLGTWRGNSTENWDPKISTLLQVLISIQSIIMSDLVYFNEPSCEAEMGKPEGEARNEGYSNIVKYCNIKYAIIEQIKKPSKGFEEVIYRHFYLKKNQIIEEVKEWIQKSKTTNAKYTSFSYDHNPSWAQKMNSQQNFTKMMEDIFVELDKELNQLPIPSELQKKQEESAKNVLNKKSIKEKLEFISLEDVDVAYENETYIDNTKEINIDDDKVKDRWSRYIGAMGIDAVQRQANANIFLSGANGLGIEIAKNIVLSGCKKFVLHDTKKTSYLDLSSQFFLSEEDINFNRAEKSSKKLQQLNFYVKVSSNTEIIPKTEEDLDNFGLKDFNVVILTECDYETLIAINKYCRKRNIIFISADLYGVFGRIINDFGDNFTVNDIDGEELKDCMIKSITNEKEGLVTVLDNTRHNFQDGDEIIISEIVGMKLKESKDLIFIDEKDEKSRSINGTKHVVKVKNPQSFYIGDTTIFNPYERNGVAKQIKSIKKVQFKELEKVLYDSELSSIDPNMSISDFTKISHSIPLHIGFQALNDFYINFKTLPSPWDYDDYKKFNELCVKISQGFKYTFTNKDKKLLAFLSFTAKTQFNPMAAFFGGLIAQEAIKAITGKFMPVNQTFYYDSIEVLPGFEIKEDDDILLNLEKLLKEENFKLTNSRIDGINIIVGKQILEKINQMKILVVGAGAIGCELLKNFAMLEVGSLKSKKTDKDSQEETQKNGIFVTDPDVIEVSNLNRQFLFREKHLRLPKSSTAAAAIIQMNKNLKNNIFAKLDKVCEETEHIFTDKFFGDLSLVANALDNIKARRYVDSRCVSNRIPLLESGTLGPKGHVQVVVPFKTESYASQQDPEVSTDIPQCTLKMFPEEALHCIEWARDLFGKLFSQKPKNFNRILEEGIETQEFKLVKQAVNLLKNKPLTFNDCMKLAREKFEKLFKNNIKQLMFSYPLDKKNKDGSLFWSLPKRSPVEIDFNFKDPLHYSFIAAYACLIANQFKIKIPYENPRKDTSKIDIAEISSTMVLPEFKINTLKAKEIEKQVEKDNKEKLDDNKIELEEVVNDDNQILQKLVSEYNDLTKKHQIDKYNELSQKEKNLLELNAEEFEKDNDANYHIDVIYALANLRCRNYKLDEMDWMKVKIKAGKIIPALATTTAAIAGLQALELVKLAKKTEINHIRNSFLNLAIPFMQASEPGPASKNKLSDNVYVTLWDRWEFKIEKNTLESIYQHLKNIYGLYPRDCFLGKKAIYPYNAYATTEKKAARQELLNKDLHKLLDLNPDEEYIDLMITFTKDENSEEYIKNTPITRILFK